MDDLLREFVGETLDMMEAVSGDLVAWEADPSDRSGLDRIFRTVHTVKGSSSFFDLPRITAIAHAAENILDALRARRRAPSKQAVLTILAAFDQIRDLTHSVGRDGREQAGADEALLAALNANVRSRDHDRRNGGARPPVVAERISDPDTQASVRVDDGSHPHGDVLAAQTGSTEWRSVRVPLTLLDDVMSGVSDLVLARNEVAVQLRVHGIDPSNLSAFQRLSGLLGGVRDRVSQMRMVRLRQMFAPLPRLVRQLCDELDKQVNLVTDGGEVEIDREVIEALRDPIVHVLRNAIDHGIESADTRAECGKPAVATLTISGRQAGNRIHISVRDDGAGLAEQQLIDRAVAAKHMSADQAALLSSAQIANLIFLPGISTAQAVTGISGRGVGMDVVKANVEKLGGIVRIDNRVGRGVTITIDVPMTLTIISALAIDVCGQGFAVPRSVVEEVLLASNDAVRRVDAGGAQMARVRGRLLPLVTLESLLGLPPDKGDPFERALIICRLAGKRTFALDVPDVRDHDELVIKPLPPMLLSVGIYNGFSLPDNGRPMLVLDVDGIAARAVADGQTSDDSNTEQITSSDDARNESARWLCYSNWHGSGMSALPMASIERLIDIGYDQLRYAGGQLVAHIGEHMMTVEDEGFAIPAEGFVRMICITDGARSRLIPARDVSHLASLTMQMPAHNKNSLVVGLAMFDGAIVEMMDVQRLLDRLSVANDRTRAPLRNRPEKKRKSVGGQ